MIKLSALSGGGGMFTIESQVSNRITVGQTGTLLSVPEVSGKAYKITCLATQSNSVQAGMSLVIDGVTVFDEQSIMDQTPSSSDMSSLGDSFGVSAVYANTSNTTIGTRILREIYCTSFSLIKNAGNTSETIDYVYQIGSFK